MQQINNRRSWFLIVVFTPTTGDVCAFARFSIFLMLGTARDKLTLRQRVTMNYCAMCFSLLLSPQTFSVIVDWHKHARPNARTATDLFDSDAITIFFLSAQIKWNVNPRVRLRSLMTNDNTFISCWIRLSIDSLFALLCLSKMIMREWRQVSCQFVRK